MHTFTARDSAEGGARLLAFRRAAGPRMSCASCSPDLRSQVTAAEMQFEREVIRMMTEQTNEDWMRHMFLEIWQWVTHT